MVFPATALLLLFSTNAAAQANSSAVLLCKDAKSQLEMNECFATAYKAADKELNAVYDSVKGKLNRPQLTQLQEAQRAWIKYRDANCEADAARYEGGSIRPSIRTACMERVTQARIAEVREVYRDELEGRVTQNH